MARALETDQRMPGCDRRSWTTWVAAVSMAPELIETEGVIGHPLSMLPAHRLLPPDLSP